MDEYNENKIEKLTNGETYHMWKFELMIYLRAHGLEEITLKSGVEDEKGKFRINDAKAQKIILNTIDRKLKTHLVYCKNAYEMFKKLCQIFEGCEQRHKSLLLQDFFNFTYNNQKISELISQIENLAMRLNNLGQKIDDEMIISKILTCLPSRFSYFVTAWESTPDEKKNLNNLTNRLLQEESRNTDIEEKTVAFRAENKKRKCFKCNKIGHLKKDCKMCGICKKYNHNEVDCKFKAIQCKFCKKTNHKEENCYFRSNNNKHTVGNVAFFTTKNNKKEEYTLNFIVDSGCTAHMTSNKKILTNFIPMESEILIANDDSMLVSGEGTVLTSVCKLEKTLLVPNLTQNLMSVHAITNNGGTVIFKKETVEIYKNSELVLIGKKKNGLYTVDLEMDEYTGKLLLTQNIGSALEWHEKLGHPSKKVLEILPQVADGIQIINNNNIENCEVCIQSKQTRLPFNTTRTRASRLLEIIHTDVCGPFEELTHDGYKYFVTVMDDYSHFTKVYLLKQKSDTKECIINYIEEVEREKSEKVVHIRCDNGGEYTSNNLKLWCKQKGIQLDYTIPYTPQLNGKAERLNRTLMEKVRALLFQSKLSKDMWGEALYCATYLLNRLPTETLNNITPYELWNRKKPNLSNIIKFGSITYMKQLHPNIKKLDPRSKKLIMVGYTNNGYRLWSEREKRIETARDIIVLKEERREKETRAQSKTITNLEENINVEEDINLEDSYNLDEKNNLEENSEDEVEEKDYVLRHSTRRKKKPIKLLDYAMLSYNEAVTSTEKKNWEKAINLEKESLRINNTWEIVNIEAKGRKILTNKWVFSIKDDGTYKARLVVRGFQQENIDHEEICSPVVSQSALKTIFAIAASMDYEMMTFDVKTAFLYGELSEDIFMTIPEGYETSPNKICRLKKALYGLKQAPITWNKKFTATMLNLGLKPTQTDQCVFSNDDKTVIIAVYVDDGLAISKDKEKLVKILKCLEYEFKIKIYEKPTNYIGFQVKKTEDGIMLSQEKYTERLLERFNMKDCKPASTPYNSDKKKENNGPVVTNFPYRELIGGLLYLSTRSRPDISHAVNEASKKIENTTKDDIVAAKKILKYLNGTREKGIKYLKGGEISNLEAYSDADYANCTETRRSTTGYIIMLAGGPVAWCSKRQPIVALSSTEAEYIAAADCYKESLYLRSFLSELTMLDIKTLLNIDNQSSIQLIKTGSFNKRSKHIDVRYYFIYENYKKGRLKIKHCPTDMQIADLLTKPLLKNKFEFHCNKIVKKY